MNKKRLAELKQAALEMDMDFDNLVEGLELLNKQTKIIARSAKKLCEWQGENEAPSILGTAILGVLQISVYDDSEYMHSVIVALRDIYAQAVRDNASASALFEIMAQTSLLEKNSTSE